MPVIDASVLVEYLAGGTHAEAIRARLLGTAEPLWAPHLTDAHVGHVLRRAVLVRELSPSRAREALVDLAEMPLHRAAHGALLQRAWSLREAMSFHYGMYAALAESSQRRC